MQNDWKAGVNDYFLGMSMTEVNKRVGTKRLKQKEFHSSFEFLQVAQTSVSQEMQERLRRTDQESIRAFLDTPLEQIPYEALPDSWDWSNVGGQNFVSRKAISQDNCGSCYSISTIEMLESRLLIQSAPGSRPKHLSMQFPVSCSFYTEGCEGGFPTLVSKFISQFGVPAESCMRYEASNVSCASACDPEDAEYWVTVSSYGYLGGYYGASTEELMMKELRARGPFAVSFEPGYDFSYYVEGVYKHTGNRQDGEESMRDSNIPWEQVDHSVLLVGWGDDNGVPYWKLLNSWGKNWGESGYFRLRRGNDESGVESMAEIAVPQLLTEPLI